MLNLKNKWAIIAGTTLVAGSLLAAGAVYASDSAPATPSGTTQPAKPDFKTHLDDAVKAGKLTQGEADVMKQLDDLRQAAMDKLKSDSQAVIDQAVKDGKITQEQADKLSKPEGRGGFVMKGGPGFGRGPGHGPGAGPKDGFFGRGPVSQDDMKAKLNAEVQAGKLTQEQADKILQGFAQHQAERAQREQGTSQGQS